MKNLAIIIIALASVLFSACQKDTVWVYYDETGCADKWGVKNVPDAEKIKNVKKYLRRRGIHVITLEITNDGIFDLCEACYCKTGKRIKCEIYKTDLHKAYNENFYQ